MYIARIRSFAMNIMRFNDVNNVSRELYRNALNMDNVLGYDGIEN